MGFIQDKKTGEWYKEGTTPPWMTEEEAKAEEPKPEAKAEAEPPQEARTIVVNDQEVKIAVESDKAAKERGELVDAWYNQTTRRWETPRQHMYKDAMLSSLIMLKPPAQVYKPNQSFAGESRASQPKLARTLSGVALADAYRQRQTGSRSGA